MLRSKAFLLQSATASGAVLCCMLDARAVPALRNCHVLQTTSTAVSQFGGAWLTCVLMLHSCGTSAGYVLRGAVFKATRDDLPAMAAADNQHRSLPGCRPPAYIHDDVVMLMLCLCVPCAGYVSRGAVFKATSDDLPAMAAANELWSSGVVSGELQVWKGIGHMRATHTTLLCSNTYHIVVQWGLCTLIFVMCAIAPMQHVLVSTSGLCHTSWASPCTQHTNITSMQLQRVSITAAARWHTL